MAQSSSVDRWPAGRRNELMEKFSQNCLRLRGRKLTAVARPDALEQVISRLLIVPALMWKSVAAGDAIIHGAPPGGGTMVGMTVTDASTPATTSFIKGDPAQVHTFAAPGVKQTMTASFTGNGNAKGRGSLVA